MTDDASLLNDYLPCHNHSTIHVANNSVSNVMRLGYVQLTQNLILKNVLHIPNLACNLLSVGKLTHDIESFAKFSPSLCVFQEADSEMMIGSAKMCSGLYLIDVTSIGPISTHLHQRVSHSCYSPCVINFSVNKKDDVRYGISV